MILGVEDRVNDAFPLQQARQVLADLDGNRAHEDWPSLIVNVFDLLKDGAEFLALGFID